MASPEVQKAVWGLDTASREATPTRERVSMAGLWQWQPAGDELDSVPTDGWGYVRVPGSWPGGRRREGSPSFYPDPAWGEDQLQNVTAAWYQVELAVPTEWAGRRVALTTDFLGTFASVYVDGKKMDDMQFPGGEVDLTSVCRPGEKHTLSVLVLALPLRGIMLAFNDTNSAREVEGSVRNKGLCGNVYLVGTPRGARLGHTRVETSVRNWQITFNTALDGVDPRGSYVLHAQVRDGEKAVKEFTSDPFRGTELENGRIRISKNWRPEKLWDMNTPQNQYDVTVSLLDPDGKLLDEALPDRFGFREFWIEGRFFYLNGSRVFLSFRRGGPRGDYERARQQMRDLKTVGINFVACGGFGAAPGDHTGFEEVLRAADDEGTLVALTQPHYRQYDWHSPDAEETNGYAGHARFYTRVAGNHPSVVFYAANHNGTGYSEDMNPDTIDGINNPRQSWQTRNASWALRAQAIVNRFDPTRVYYHHSSGNLGPMFTSNFYANFTPVQEMDDWFEHWATYGRKPMHTCEYGVPLGWDWAMYRGWYKGRREFGSAEVPWEFCIAEWNAQFFGPESYKISEREVANLRWEAEKFRNGELWQRWDYPYRLNYDHPERDPVMAMYFTENWRAFRTWGLSVNAPEGYRGPLSTAALVRNNGPVLAYIGGKPSAFTSKDHNFLPGETVEKQIIIINNSRETVTCDCEWSMELPRAVSGTKTVRLPTGEQERIPLTFELPAGLAPGQYTLAATVRFSNGETQDGSFTVDVLPTPQTVKAAGRIALFDPKGETATMLTDLGVAFAAVDADADLAACDVLVIGKGALTLDSPAPDISRVRDGLKVVVFEQTGEVLEKRFGFRIAEYGLRWVFKRVPDHPLLAGIADEHLWNWRGEATILPPRIEYDLDYSPTVEWCGLPLKRGWRCGNRGNVASALIEKPASGDFMPILDGGYALQYAPLMEYREGKGMVLFCQMDVTGRTETDPAALALARNILRHVSSWKAAPRRTVVYAGEAGGGEHLEAAGLSPTAYDGGKLSAGQVLVVGPGGGQQLARNAAAVKDWVRAGGAVLAVGLTGEEASTFLPSRVSTTAAEHIAAYFEPFGVGSPLAGVSPADVHNRDPRELPLVSGGAMAVGDGVLGQAEGANVVFCQLAPWQLDYSGEKMNIKRTFRKLSYCTTRLLANMGAAGQTPLLAHVSRPVEEGEKRWLAGFYLDEPEVWDDPYRFFRW